MVLLIDCRSIFLGSIPTYLYSKLAWNLLSLIWSYLLFIWSNYTIFLELVNMYDTGLLLPSPRKNGFVVASAGNKPPELV